MNTENSDRPTAEIPSEDRQLSVINGLLKAVTGIDFSCYKTGSVLRRIKRRMGINGLASLQEYAGLLEGNEAELLLLKKDLLIGVTRFYRDPDAFAALRSKVLPSLFKGKGRDREIRIWTVGCSTGEEAYSLAIMIHLYLELKDKAFRIKIFATDVDKDAVEFAGAGLYSEPALSGLPQDIVERYFVEGQDGYTINKDIRKMIVFAPHNILKDPPYNNMDLIVCRNTLIYLRANCQRKVVSLFHYAMNPSGFLFLGPSETVGKLTHLFALYEKNWSIYKYKEYTDMSLSGAVGFDSGGTNMYRNSRERYDKKAETRPEIDSHPVEKALIRKFMQPCMVIDENDELLYTCGDVRHLLRIPQGKPSHNILKMLCPSLSIAVGSALHVVRKEQVEVVYRLIKLDDAPEPAYVNLRADLLDAGDGSKHIALLFEKTEGPALVDSDELPDSGNNANRRISELERELQNAEAYLQATIEELEASNQELQATNEELIAANEELQSTNEELQSLNEEMATINGEYQSKIHALTELNNDLDNLLVNTKIGTVFLDRKLCIRRFTPSVTNEINLLEVDIGRPLSHISHNFKYNAIIKDAQSVLWTGSPLEKEIQSRLGYWYKMRILPYLYNEKLVDGVVITFLDITELKSANEELQLLSHAIEQSPSVIVIANPIGLLEYVNPKFTECTGYSYTEAIGKSMKWLYKLHPEEGEKVWEQVRSGRKWEGELENCRKDGARYWEFVTIIPILNGDGEIIHYLRVAENITGRKQTEEMLRKSEMLSAVGQLAAGIAHEIRNPLTALKGFTKLLRSRDQENRYTDIMSTELDRIESIISELLILAKPQALKFYEKDLITIVREVIMLLNTQAIMNNVEIQEKYGLEKCMVLCVDYQLKQVFINLLKNAIEAMPDGGLIQVNLEKAGEKGVRIVFSDQGPGIPEEHLPHLGQPFYTTKEKGTGLGLMMSYKIVENHQGTMTIESKLGIGTTVTILLPIAGTPAE